MAFKRTVWEQLEAWKKRHQRKPVLVLGARQVGKTWLLKQFGNQAFKQTAYFNFQENPELGEFFSENLDAKRIIQNLSLLLGEEIVAGDTLLIFDEIQECPAAITALKYFAENVPKLHVAAAGSLLGVELAKPGSFPVGKVEFLHVYPLSFAEFLTIAEPGLHAFLEKRNKGALVPQIFHTRLHTQFKNYMVCGGMPEVAAAFLEDNDFANTTRLQKQILTAYLLDFAKHPEALEVARLGLVWSSIPSQLAKENKKFLYQLIKNGARGREYEDSIRWLNQAGLINKVNRCVEPRLPLSAYDDLEAFKIYLFDTGLLRCMASLEPSAILNGNELFTEFKGSMAENYILQSLIAGGVENIRYWTSKGDAEIDFLFQFGNEIIPVEVKSGENTKSKSLAVYNQKFNPDIRIRYSLKPLNYKDGLLNIPLFLADQTLQIVNDVLKNGLLKPE